MPKKAKPLGAMIKGMTPPKEMGGKMTLAQMTKNMGDAPGGGAGKKGAKKR